MRNRMLWTLVMMSCATGGTQSDDTDVSSADDTDLSGVDDTDLGTTATCDDPGTPTTPTPTAIDDVAAMNVTALDCTRTAVALACELGVEHAYKESVSGGTRSITANGVVNHDVGAFPNPGNPNTISAQAYSYTVPVTPSGQGSVLQMGPFGVLFTGSVLDPSTAETWNDDAGWRYEALRYGTSGDYFGTDSNNHPSALGVDCNLAHVQPTGAYHYHGVPTSLVPSTPAVKQVGWAADGYPIVILYGHDDPADVSSDVRILKSSYRLKSGTRPGGSPGGTYDGTFVADWEFVDGLGDLDACNGREDTVSIGGKATRTYVYVLTETFPFISRCTIAKRDASFAQVGGGGGGGGGGGAPADCAPGQTFGCCGDGTCDGPETQANCADDCP